MTARGKGQRPPGPPTEPLPPVTVAPEFRARHVCRATPPSVRVLQVPPYGWVAAQLDQRIGAAMYIKFCPFCGRELEASP